MYIYLSEQDDFTDFNNEDALFWSLKGLEYGDWTSGPNGDGSYIKEGKIQTPPVRNITMKTPGHGFLKVISRLV